MFEAEHSLCSKQNIPCVRSKTFLVLEARHSVCSKQDIPRVRSKTFLLFEAQTSNGSKLARIAPISTIFGRNRSRRPELFFRKFSRRRNFRVAEKFSRRTSERTYERAKKARKVYLNWNGAFHVQPAAIKQNRHGHMFFHFPPYAELVTAAARAINIEVNLA